MTRTPSSLANKTALQFSNKNDHNRQLIIYKVSLLLALFGRFALCYGTVIGLAYL